MSIMVPFSKNSLLFSWHCSLDISLFHVRSPSGSQTPIRHILPCHWSSRKLMRAVLGERMTLLITRPERRRAPRGLLNTRSWTFCASWATSRGTDTLPHGLLLIWGENRDNIDGIWEVRDWRCLHLHLQCKDAFHTCYFELKVRWPKELNALQLKKTHANR